MAEDQATKPLRKANATASDRLATPQLGEDMADMGFDSRWADHQPSSDLRVILIPQPSMPGPPAHAPSDPALAWAAGWLR